jgi:hypothetical protein
MSLININVDSRDIVKNNADLVIGNLLFMFFPIIGGVF